MSPINFIDYEDKICNLSYNSSKQLAILGGYENDKVLILDPINKKQINKLIINSDKDRCLSIFSKDEKLIVGYSSKGGLFSSSSPNILLYDLRNMKEYYENF